MRPALAGGAVVVAVTALLWGRHEITASCAVGITGTNTTIAIAGWGADGACRSMIAADSGWVYLREEPPTGDVICETRRGSRHYAVRDKGMLMLVGRATCAALNDPKSWTKDGEFRPSR